MNAIYHLYSFVDGAIEYTDCSSAGGRDPTSNLNMTLNYQMVRLHFWDLQECGDPVTHTSIQNRSARTN